MRNYYQDFKNLHDGIKPIRGRAEDVRPIGQRRRTWETIEMEQLDDIMAGREPRPPKDWAPRTPSSGEGHGGGGSAVTTDPAPNAA